MWRVLLSCLVQCKVHIRRAHPPWRFCIKLGQLSVLWNSNQRLLSPSPPITYPYPRHFSLLFRHLKELSSKNLQGSKVVSIERSSFRIEARLDVLCFNLKGKRKNMAFSLFSFTVCPRQNHYNGEPAVRIIPVLDQDDAPDAPMSSSAYSCVTYVCGLQRVVGFNDSKWRGLGWHHAHGANLYSRGLEWTGFRLRATKATTSSGFKGTVTWDFYVFILAWKDLSRPE